MSDEFAMLFRRFELEYGDACVRLASQMRATYPEITRRGRRTGRALRNICFFAWSCCRDDDRELIPALYRAAVLLSAQDDYFDNTRISAAQKESFCTAANVALRSGSFRAFRRDCEHTLQLRDLASLWSYVAETIPRTAPRVRSYWVETACRLNDAMVAEDRARRRATTSFEEYMRTATDSIGMVFIWATCLAHEHVSIRTLREMEPILVDGAKVVRLSNDLASYRQHRDRDNAVTLVGGRSPGTLILRSMTERSRDFRHRVEALDVEPRVRGVLLHSMDFLREFYQRSDFHRGPAW